MKKALTFAALLAALGCDSGPSAVRPPDVDASGSASKAMELYDKDSNGSIGGEELDAVPAFKSTMEKLDTSGDGAVQEDEIAARIDSWQASGVGAQALMWTVTLDGKPVEGAKVTFEPEPFLDGALQTAEGETSPIGVTTVSIPKANRPTEDTPPGMQLGFYRVRISKESGGKETIPAKYNTESTLGQEIAPDAPAVASQKLRLELTSK